MRVRPISDPWRRCHDKPGLVCDAVWRHGEHPPGTAAPLVFLLYFKKLNG